MTTNPELPPYAQPAYISGYKDGLEKAAQHCDHVADLCMTVLETDCSREAELYRIRAKDIRALKPAPNQHGGSL